MKVTWILLFWLPLFAADAVSHRYVIELSGPSVAEHITNESRRTGRRIAIDSDVAKSRRQQLRDEQKQARTALEGLGIKILGATDTVSNTLIVDMPDSLVEQVAALPGVKRVRKAQVYKTHLDHALPLHHIPDAWAVVGGMANAGQGIKIGMIDSGIDITHPGMQDSTMQVPAGFPKVNANADTAFTNSKVIVARSYAALFITVEDDLSARDVDGHGTLTAMTAAGAQNTGPFGTIVGVAPKAWLGAYKVNGASGQAGDDVIQMAIDDAVKDGMDVINLSLGGTARRLSDDSLLQVPLANATALGVVVVISAGNDSYWSRGWDPNTVQSPGTAPTAITVGASYNDREFFPASVTMAGGIALAAFTDNGPDATNPPPSGPVSGQLFDVSTLDTIGDACLPFPKGTMTGKIALIIRGSCNFEDKMNDVQGAGAVGALIYASPTNDLLTLPGYFSAGAATLPTVIVFNGDGVALKQQLAANPSLSATLNFTTTSIPELNQANYVAFFSGMGPSVDGSIKPDMVAVGTDFYGATEATAPNQDLYDPSGYTTGASGTSISAPLVAGTVALVKALRPGLTVDQYRSLVINTAGTIRSVDSVTGNSYPQPRHAGGRRLVECAGRGDVDVRREAHCAQLQHWRRESQCFIEPGHLERRNIPGNLFACGGAAGHGNGRRRRLGRARLPFSRDSRRRYRSPSPPAVLAAVSMRAISRSREASPASRNGYRIGTVFPPMCPLISHRYLWPASTITCRIEPARGLTTRSNSG